MCHRCRPRAEGMTETSIGRSPAGSPAVGLTREISWRCSIRAASRDQLACSTRKLAMPRRRHPKNIACDGLGRAAGVVPTRPSMCGPPSSSANLYIVQPRVHPSRARRGFRSTPSPGERRGERHRWRLERHPSSNPVRGANAHIPCTAVSRADLEEYHLELVRAKGRAK